MQNQIIKQEIFDNTVDAFVAVNPTKQQLAFFPKEESQMFTSKTYDYVTGTAENESENTDQAAFMQRGKKDDSDNGVVTPVGDTEVNFTTGSANGLTVFSKFFVGVTYLNTSGNPDTSVVATNRNFNVAAGSSSGTPDFNSDNFFMKTSANITARFKGTFKFKINTGSMNVQIYFHTQTRQLDIVAASLGSGEHEITFDKSWGLVQDEQVYLVIGGFNMFESVTWHESLFTVSYDIGSTSVVASSESVDLEQYGVMAPYPSGVDKYKYNLQLINSSHTATDYIGATSLTVATLIEEAFADFKLHNIVAATTEDLYDAADTAAKIRTVVNGMQVLRIPENRLNTILTDINAIEANGNSDIQKNFGLYYIVVSPKYVETAIGNVLPRLHVPWVDMPNNVTAMVGVDDVTLTPDAKRRTIYECDKDSFKNLEWNFEASNEQSGRLYGSVVEIWDASVTKLKQVKIMTENEFNFDTPDTMRFVLYPDNVGYDTPDDEPVTGDVIRVYPRETYFNQFIIEVNYKNKATQLENLLAFMLNDTVRDMKTGIVEIYDDRGFQIDLSGNFLGTVISRYQIFQTDKYEARKVIKK